MIDFRYHLVSLVSVFLALAIGIVLGAGPLRESIGDTLTNQVDALRRDKENLQLAVANRDEQIQHRDEFVVALGGEVVPGRLEGRSVVVVALPEAGGDAVDGLAAQVEAAGGAVVARVGVAEAWTDPDAAAFRQNLTGQLLQYLDPAPPADAGTAGEAASLLAWAIAAPGTAGGGDGGPDVDPDAATVVEALRGGDLVTVDGEPGRRASLVLVATGGAEVPPGEDPAAAADSAAEWLPLVEALEAYSDGAVVAGPLAGAEAGGVLGAVRGSALADAVPTVDSADTPMGRIAVTLTLAVQPSEPAGHYGFGEGATAVLPDVPAAGPAS